MRPEHDTRQTWCGVAGHGAVRLGMAWQGTTNGPENPQLRAVTMSEGHNLKRPSRHWLHLAEGVTLLTVAICVVLAVAVIGGIWR